MMNYHKIRVDENDVAELATVLPIHGTYVQKSIYDEVVVTVYFQPTDKEQISFLKLKYKDVTEILEAESRDKLMLRILEPVFFVVTLKQFLEVSQG